MWTRPKFRLGNSKLGKLLDMFTEHNNTHHLLCPCCHPSETGNLQVYLAKNRRFPFQDQSLLTLVDCGSLSQALMDCPLAH